MSILFTTKYEKFNQIRPLEGNFTEVLDTIALKPKILYFYGKIPEKRVKTVAIVGSRKPTEYGRKIAFNLAKTVVEKGGIVVSGLAYGIDAEGHKGALAGAAARSDNLDYGATIAVLGTPIDQIYPRANMGLAEQILAQGGSIMSEMLPGTEYFPKTTFLERNRIIAGLADVVVIVEAAERSGSLNTAAHALDQGKDVFAVPADITRPMSAGCNRLIRQGATPFLDNKDVLDALFPPKRKLRRQKILPIGDTPLETGILQAIYRGIQDGEKILQATNISPSEFNQAITMLELKDLVLSLGANKWALV